MPQWLEQLFQHIRDHGSKLLAAAVFAVIGWGAGRWRARRAWAKRDFPNRLNFSLNLLDGGKLFIRTLLEKSCEEIFLSQSAVERVLASAEVAPVFWTTGRHFLDGLRGRSQRTVWEASQGVWLPRPWWERSWKYAFHSSACQAGKKIGLNKVEQTFLSVPTEDRR